MKTSPCRLATQRQRIATIEPTGGSWRAMKKSSTARGYGYAWQQARLAHLRSYPLCVMCLEGGRTTAGTVVDHKVAHRGNQDLFWDRSNWQTLCKTHHDSVAQVRDHAAGAAATVPGR